MTAGEEVALTFDEVAHVYRVGGRALPSVTQVLSVLGIYNGVRADVLEAARSKGIRVDAATLLLDTRGDVDAIDDEIIPYALAWSHFLRDSRCEILASQVRSHNPVYGYAGTLDRVVKWANGEAGIIEIKATAVIEPAGALQTAAYAAMGDVIERWGKMVDRHTIQLKPDGAYQVQRWTDRSDLPTFLAVLTIYNWRHKWET